MSENRIRLRSGTEQVEHEADTVDVRSDVDVRVTTSLGFMSQAGMVLVLVGCAALLVALALLLVSFPDRLYAFEVPRATARMYVEAILLTLGSGIVLTLLGATFHFYGRSVLGRRLAEEASG